MIDPVLSPVELLSPEKGIEQRAEIRALEHGITAADYKIKAEKTWMIPKVQLDGFRLLYRALRKPYQKL
jgi:outer membrane protein TolC